MKRKESLLEGKLIHLIVCPISQEFIDEVSNPSHLQRYLSIYSSKAGIEISRTYRYKCSKKVESCILATQTFKKGDELKYCQGVITMINEEQEISLAERDFSVMYSTKRNSNCLFLGPAHFVNHDCDSNTKVKYFNCPVYFKRR
jgi:hypothetical protein